MDPAASTSQNNMAAGSSILNSNVPLPPNLSVTGDLASQWKKWKQIWDSFEIVTALNSKEKAYRIATFITCIGPDAIEIYNGLPFASKEEKKDIDKVTELFGKHCIGESNVIYERYILNNRNQEPGESFDNLITSLRALSLSCDYGALREEMIRDRIVNGCRDNSLRKHLLQEPKLTLQRAIDKGRATESSQRQLKAMTAETNEVKAVRRRTTPKPANSSQRINCRYCGESHARDKRQCPAYGATCGFCNKQNHVEAKCMSKQKPHVKAGYRSKTKTRSVRQCDDYSDYSESDDF